MPGFQRRSAKGLTYPFLRGSEGADVTALVQTLDHFVIEQWAPDEDTISALSYGYKGGVILSGSSQVRINDGTLPMDDEAVNYVERDSAGVVTSNAVGFTATKTPMAKVTTAGGRITDIEDWRPMGQTPGGGGGSGIAGSGTANKVAKFTGTATIGNSQINDDGSVLVFGADPGGSEFLRVGGSLRVSGAATLLALLTLSAGLTVSSGAVTLPNGSVAIAALAPGTDNYALFGTGATPPEYRRIAAEDVDAGTFPGASYTFSGTGATTTAPQVHIGPASGPAYLRLSAASGAANEVGLLFGTTSGYRWEQYIVANATGTMRWYCTGTGEVMSLTSAGLLTLAGGLSVTGGSISATGITATVGTLNLSGGYLYGDTTNPFVQLNGAGGYTNVGYSTTYMQVQATSMIWKVSGTYRLSLNAGVLMPYTTLGLQLGATGSRWGAAYLSTVDASGLGTFAAGLAVTTGGAAVATSGLIRLPSQQGIKFRNAANGGDLFGLDSDASDNIRLAGGVLKVSTAAPASLTVDATGALAIAGSGTAAASGMLRLPSAEALKFRNAANTGDLFGLDSDASDNIRLAAGVLTVSTAAPVAVTVAASGLVTLGYSLSVTGTGLFQNTGGSNTVQIDSNSNSRVLFTRGGSTTFSIGTESGLGDGLLFRNTAGGGMMWVTQAGAFGVSGASDLSGGAVTLKDGDGLKWKTYDAGVFADATYLYLGSYSTPGTGLKIAYGTGAATFSASVSMGALTATGTTTFNGVAYTWPGTAGANGNVLTSNGSGGLSWTAGGGSGLGGSGTAGTISKWSAPTTLADSHISDPAYSLAFTLSGATTVSLPTSGTLVTTAVTTLSSLVSIGTISTGVWQGTSISTTYTDAKVTSVAGRTGAVTLTVADIGAGTFPAGDITVNGLLTLSGYQSWTTSNIKRQLYLLDLGAIVWGVVGGKYAGLLHSSGGLLFGTSTAIDGSGIWSQWLSVSDAGGMTVGSVSSTWMDVDNTYSVAGTQVVAARRTGWTDQSAVASRANLGASPTVAALASFCSALYADLKAHGLIGN